MFFSLFGLDVFQQKSKFKSLFQNISLEVFITYDGAAPTVTPWTVEYSANSSGEYIRSEDGVNFISYSSLSAEEQVLFASEQRWTLTTTLVDAIEVYTQESDLGADEYEAYYFNYSGRVFL
jgi:hypothetical protein